MEIIFDGDSVKGRDAEGNEIYYVQNGRELKVLFASYNDVIYNKTSAGWSRSKRGGVSKAFYAWYEAAHRDVYEQYYRA